MWSYYGRKKKIIKKYPEPITGRIVEPFAGTASYAYTHWENDCIIIDKFDKIIRIWKYLQNASSKDLLSLPEVENGECIKHKHAQLCEEERWLIGFCINNASQIPKHTAGRMNFNSWSRDKIRISKDLFKIRHWNFILGEYSCIENITADWFIDPPYQFQNLYTHNDVNYSELDLWCKERKGQVIVCENSKGSWMEFSTLTELSGQRTKTTEVIWHKITAENK
ncbi:hypothetical protein HN960_05485 [Candidatus Peregrinibacteria bacterium]|nr:hypothetical protein [Candidatus Peregrinibacteria bacterium]